MTTANWDGLGPEELDAFVAAAHEAVDRHMEFEDRYQAFSVKARNVHGPLGELFRDIAAQHDRFRRDELLGHTTVGETNRWSPVVESAMGAVDFLDGVDL